MKLVEGEKDGKERRDVDLKGKSLEMETLHKP